MEKQFCFSNTLQILQTVKLVFKTKYIYIIFLASFNKITISSILNESKEESNKGLPLQVLGIKITEAGYTLCMI